MTKESMPNMISKIAKFGIRKIRKLVVNQRVQIEYDY